MKCMYCDQLDHLESSCPTRKADRRTEVGLGCFLMVVMAPFYVLGLLAGMVKSAFKAGFGFTDDFWPETWKAIRGKKKDDGEQVSD